MASFPSNPATFYTANSYRRAAWTFLGLGFATQIVLLRHSFLGTRGGHESVNLLRIAVNRCQSASMVICCSAGD
jgi:hypothetical protein